MDDLATALLAQCRFPPPPGPVDLAVSGGPDSTGLLLLARAAGLEVRVHHVDHHLRSESASDADFVAALARDLGVPATVHDVVVAPGPNLEERARTARRAVLPPGTLTGHTMDDLAETVLLNLLRGAGLDGLSPMVGDPTKPLLALRRRDVAALVAGRGLVARHDTTNDDSRFRRNRVRADVLPLLDAVAERDVVPLLARTARVLAEERRLLDEVVSDDRALGEVDCRELAAWSPARLARWLRERLRDDQGHPPSAGELERAAAVVRGEARATELSGGRRLARRHQTVRLE